MSVQQQKPKPGLAAALLIPLAIWIVVSLLAVIPLVRGFQSYSNAIDDFARIDSGEETVVDLRSTGGYRVWIERPDLGDEDSFRPPTEVRITGPDGQPVDVQPYSIATDLSYSDGDREGQAVQTFNVDEPGEHTITATATDGRAAVFAIGKTNPVAEIGKGVGLFIAIGTLGFVIALIVLIIMLVRRGRSKKRIVQSQVAAGGYGGGYGGGAPQGYGGGAPQGYAGQGYPPPAGPPAGAAPPGYGAPAPSPGPFGGGGGTPPPAPPSPPGWNPPPPGQ